VFDRAYDQVKVGLIKIFFGHFLGYCVMLAIVTPFSFHQMLVAF